MAIVREPGGSGEDTDVAAKAPSERIVEFGWADSRPVTGRRAAKDKEKKKLKAGSFGKLLLHIHGSANNYRPYEAANKPELMIIERL